MSKGIIESLLPSIDSILSIRDSIGAIKKPVYIVTRTWAGTEPGDGAAKDVEAPMRPSPGVKDVSQDFRLREGGMVRAGDIFLSQVSKHSFKISDIDGTSPAQNIEKFFRVGDKIYQVINTTESYVTWTILLRQLTSQVRYL